MIIGINGYIGSGKDTVGSIIQYLTEHPKGDRSYNSFVMDVGMGYDPKWEIKKFAAKLKQIASLMTGIPVEKFEDQEFKKTYLGPEWDTFIAITGENPGTLGRKMTVREFLQKLGTEAIRDGLHVNAWVNALFADYKKSFLIGELEIDRLEDIAKERSKYPNWIITDCRFPNEAEAIKERGGLIWRVDRFRISQDITDNKLHPSETSLDNWKFDAYINNNDSIEALTVYVKSLLKYYEII